MKHQFARRFAILLLAASAAFLGGCAASPKRENMTAPAIASLKKHPFSVHVETRGGAEDSSNVSNEELKAAIEESITKNAVFKSVTQGKEGDYELAVTVTQLDKPLFGASFTVTMETAWSLVKTSNKAVVMRKSVRSSHTATMSDSMVGVTRLRMAVEGAVRNNIQEGLQALSEQKL